MTPKSRASEIQARLDQIAHVMGKVVISFNELEIRISDLVGTMLDSTDLTKGEIVCTPLRFLEKLNLAAALFNAYCEDELQQSRLKSLLSRADEINTERNALVHGEVWLDALDPSGPQHKRRRTSIRGRKGLRVVHVDIDAAGILELCERIMDLEAEIYQFESGVDWSNWRLEPDR